MAVYLLLLLMAVSEVEATFRPRQLSPCRVVEMDVYCNNMNLKQIPLELPPGFHKLDLSENLLQNITLELLPFKDSVQQLDLHSNKIQFIQPGLFQHMDNLEVLDISRNFLDVFAQTKTEIGPLPSIKTLDLSGNNLYTGMTVYFLHDAPALRNLSLSGNSITKIEADTFSGSLALSSIDLHNNVVLEIEDGAFESLQNLSELNLSMNSITCITDFNLSQLKLLNLSKNSIESFHTAELDKEYDLLYLDLSENKLLYFPELPKRNRLMYLDLSRNIIQGVITGADENDYISYGWFKATNQPLNRTLLDNGVPFTNLSSLLYLDMSYNEIKSIPVEFFSSMGSLEFLNLSNNCLESFTSSSSSSLNSLDTLDLNFNALRNLSFAENTLRALKQLYLKGNNLQILAPDTFTNLHSIKVIDLQENHMSVCGWYPRLSNWGSTVQETDCVSFIGIPTLRYLYLSSNAIRSLPQYAFRQTPLLLLDLSKNPGIEVNSKAFSGLESSLMFLSLNGNNLPALNPDLSLLTSLKNLNLSGNLLTGLPPWSKDSSLEVLDLQNNVLISLQYNVVLVLEKTLKTLYLAGNRLSCCSNPRFLHMVQKSVIDIPDIDSVTCQYVKNSEYTEISILRVAQDECDQQDVRSISIIITITTALALAVVLVVLSKYCHQRRLRPEGSYKA
ncbi:transforming growth factor beta activator LRRC32-like isoform X1 [Acipenser ruthenus]|uniref:transforming growth factor beta activator LRRC32-like isoform X1 n=1 Tax=Acipenser ruthenus TaxID=7906 RepID=UPI002741B0FE|nr:transforming growth factor beta activator LRRC32-like isoform X1 [Acipenser ruthenus]XP_034779444.2 transforming growth factor beta activator LRRC32-like isoform X1 [Acipenser ruthenus]XP_034779445.2 transforming growth factor beta activator LRRC32-like isoform X1 [Acipenser ruthenus]